MAENANTQRPWYFNLRADGDSAIVKLLHTDTSTIEVIKSHRVTIDGKSRRVRCNEGCPICASGSAAEERIYVHLFDYTDNKEKVWERTDKIIPQLVALQNSWNPLSSAVVKITRKGNEFPKYDIEVQNPMLFQDVASDLIDKPVAKLYSMNRTADEINTYLSTGSFPERKPYLSKEEYAKLKAEEKAAFQQGNTTTATSQVANQPADNGSFDDPFLN